MYFQVIKKAGVHIVKETEDFVAQPCGWLATFSDKKTADSEAKKLNKGHKSNLIPDFKFLKGK